MKLTIKDSNGKDKGSQALPEQFLEPVRPDLIKRAVQAIQSHQRQPYGADPSAGLKASADVSRRRRKYRGSYGFGISRVPRKILSRRGTRMNWVGAEVPGTVGGRRAHPPKADKIFDKKINTKERKKAIRSALAATLDKEIVKARGHNIPDVYPFIIEGFEDNGKTKEVIESLKNLGFEKELSRTQEKKIRAGKGTMRNRVYKKKKGILLVVSGPCKLSRSARNIPGLDVVSVRRLNAHALAPGCHPGRLTVFTKDALALMEKERLFV